MQEHPTQGLPTPQPDRMMAYQRNNFYISLLRITSGDCWKKFSQFPNPFQKGIKWNKTDTHLIPGTSRRLLIPAQLNSKCYNKGREMIQDH